MEDVSESPEEFNHHRGSVNARTARGGGQHSGSLTSDPLLLEGN